MESHPFVCTRDYKPDRVGLVIVDGKIKSYKMG
jgi:hypothetical protein